MHLVNVERRLNLVLLFGWLVVALIMAHHVVNFCSNRVSQVATHQLHNMPNNIITQCFPTFSLESQLVCLYY